MIKRNLQVELLYISSTLSIKMESSQECRHHKVPKPHSKSTAKVTREETNFSKQRNTKSRADRTHFIMPDFVPPQHVCPDCHEIFYFSAELKKHWASSHGGDDYYVCPGCSQIFYNPVELQKHWESSHSPEDYPFLS
jgi:uncharacterized C2H2 Zn-finger protein